MFFASDQANRIANLIYERYGVKPDFPWKDDNGVFRHLDNNKWFSLIMYVKWNALLKDGKYPYGKHYESKKRRTL